MTMMMMLGRQLCDLVLSCCNLVALCVALSFCLPFVSFLVALCIVLSFCLPFVSCCRIVSRFYVLHSHRFVHRT